MKTWRLLRSLECLIDIISDMLSQTKNQNPRRSLAAKLKLGGFGFITEHMDDASRSADRPTDLIVALDFPKPSEAAALIEALKGLDVIYKVGFELFLTGGPAFVRELTQQGKRVFLDLKFHDIPNTVCAAVIQAADMGVDMATLHLSGGRKMVEAAVAEINRAGAGTLLLGVSVLTSYSDEEWEESCSALLGESPAGTFPRVRQSVLGLVKSGVAWGIRGAVCSAHEVGELSRVYPDLYTVVPGIRPDGAQAGDQSRVMTPAQARLAGARAVVMGRPITRADDPRAAVERTLAELRSS